jgi:predicted transcriptional regulator
MARELKIGIMPRDQFKKYTLSIAKGEIKPKNSDPKIWFDSVESMAQVLSEKNRELLKTIKERKPQSLAELADVTGRKVSNLSRTLRNMEHYGIVELQKESKSLKPLVRVTTFHAIFGI